MQESLKDKLKSFSTHEAKFNALREYCQLLILKILDDNGGFHNLAFVGGTALRILYGLKRFSEDLDFCLVNQDGYSFSALMDKLNSELRLYNFAVDIRYKDHKTVASAFIKFDNIMNQAGLSPHKDQKLMVKFDVDQNPPLGYQTNLTMVTTEFLTAINHFNIPSLYAGKLHAIFCRKYEKGRDYYDLIWYLGRDVEPNFELLNNAIEQTGHDYPSITRGNFYDILLDRINQADFQKILDDIKPFIMDQRELRYFDKSVFSSLIATKLSEQSHKS